MGKMEFEHMKAGKDKFPDNEYINTQIDIYEEWLNTQRAEYLIEINGGSWSGLTTRDMAHEAGCDDLYNFGYSIFSNSTHAMWFHVNSFCLHQCTNPLHKYHRVPAVHEFDTDIDFYIDQQNMLACATDYLMKNFPLLQKQNFLMTGY